MSAARRRNTGQVWITASRRRHRLTSVPRAAERGRVIVSSTFRAAIDMDANVLVDVNVEINLDRPIRRLQPYRGSACRQQAYRGQDAKDARS
jgi:hypothetical protein